MRLSDLAHVTAFLTRLPVPGTWFGGSRLDFARQSWAFPLVALPLAAVGGLLGVGLLLSTANAPLAAIAAFASVALLTGGLHEDGLADCADGFWGGQGAERRRTIMRDSAIGTYGVLALLFVVGLRIAALVPLVALAVPVLLGTLAFGRTAGLWHWAVLPPTHASAGGPGGASLATRFGTPARGQVAIATVLSIACLAPLLFYMSWTALLGAVGAGSALAAIGTAVSRAKIGGHSGDTIGATVLLAETGFLVGLLLPTSSP